MFIKMHWNGLFGIKTYWFFFLVFFTFRLKIGWRCLKTCLTKCTAKTFLFDINTKVKKNEEQFKS